MDKIATKEALERVSQALNDKIVLPAVIEVENLFGSLSSAEKSAIQAAINKGTAPITYIKDNTSGQTISIYSYTSGSITMYNNTLGAMLTINLV